MRLIAAVLLLASSAAAQPCTVTVAPAIDPRCEYKGAQCGPSGSSDSSLWFRATMAGKCGDRPAAWTVTPGMPDGWIDGWHRDPDAVPCGDGSCAARAILRGPAGRYLVTATSETGASSKLEVTIPMPGAHGAGEFAPLTVGALRVALEGFDDDALVSLSLDGGVSRLATEAVSGCWTAYGTSIYGSPACGAQESAVLLSLH